MVDCLRSRTDLNQVDLKRSQESCLAVFTRTVLDFLQVAVHMVPHGAVFNMPIDVCFRTTNLHGWPQVVISVHGENGLQVPHIQHRRANRNGLPLLMMMVILTMLLLVMTLVERSVMMNAEITTLLMMVQFNLQCLHFHKSRTQTNP